MPYQIWGPITNITEKNELDRNIDGLREVYPTLSTGCFIQKPISISNLVKRLKSEIEWWKVIVSVAP